MSKRPPKSEPGTSVQIIQSLCAQISLVRLREVINCLATNLVYLVCTDLADIPCPVYIVARKLFVSIIERQGCSRKPRFQAYCFHCISK